MIKLGKLFHHFFNDNDLTARCKAVVQLEVTTQYFNLWYLLIIFSNFFTITLTRNQFESKHSLT